MRTRGPSFHSRSHPFSNLNVSHRLCDCPSSDMLRSPRSRHLLALGSRAPSATPPTNCVDPTSHTSAFLDQPQWGNYRITCILEANFIRHTPRVRSRTRYHAPMHTNAVAPSMNMAGLLRQIACAQSAATRRHTPTHTLTPTPTPHNKMNGARYTVVVEADGFFGHPMQHLEYTQIPRDSWCEVQRQAGHGCFHFGLLVAVVRCVM